MPEPTLISCTLDDGTSSQSVPCASADFPVAPGATTTYTLQASGASGGAVTQQVTVTVHYCHSITSASHTCSTGNTEFCRDQPISATSSDDAKAACEACYGTNQCQNRGCGASQTMWDKNGGGPNDVAYQYAGPVSSRGEILTGSGVPNPGACVAAGSRWAP